SGSGSLSWDRRVAHGCPTRRRGVALPRGTLRGTVEGEMRCSTGAKSLVARGSDSEPTKHVVRTPVGVIIRMHHASAGRKLTRPPPPPIFRATLRRGVVAPRTKDTG